MNADTVQKHTQIPYAQGRTLRTRQTEKWSAFEIAENDARERKGVYANFSEADQGRGRALVAMCVTPEDAEFIVRACNAHDDLVLFSQGLIRAWRTGKNIADAIHALESAIAKARGEADHA